MTTLAMVAGMVPSALSLGDGGEFRAPMASGVIGGLLVSTILSLVFVPSLYTVMDGLSRRTGNLLGRADQPGCGARQACWSIDSGGGGFGCRIGWTSFLKKRSKRLLRLHVRSIPGGRSQNK